MMVSLKKRQISSNILENRIEHQKYLIYFVLILDDKEEVDLTQHLTWDLTGLHGDKIRRLQDEATKLVEQLNKNKIRRQKKEAELEAVSI